MAGTAEDKNKDTNAPDVDPVPNEDDLGVELGVEYNLPFASPFSDGVTGKAKEAQNLRELSREFGEDQGPTVAQLVAMRRLDGQARALYRLLTLPIRAALKNSSFVPADDGEEEADFISDVFNLPPAQGGMSVTFHRFMSQLLQGLFDGFAPFEQVYWKPSYGPLKGKYTLKKLAYRQSDTVNVIEDEDGHFKGFRQRAVNGGKTIDIYIPAERAFYFAAQEEERKYYGVSFFQSAFYHYDKKIKMYYIAHLAAQRAAVGTRVGTYPSNATSAQKKSFASNLSNLALAQWMTVPDTFKVEVLNEGGNFPFLDYINHHNNQMSKSILANFFDKDSGGGSGDAKLVSFGQPGDDMFVLMLRAIMDDIANSINHYIIPRLIDWNFEGGKYPKFQWAELTDDQKASISASFDKLSTAGQSATVTPEFLRELEKKMAREMGLEIDWDAVETREAEEKAQINAQMGLDPEGNPVPTQATPEEELDKFLAESSGQAVPEEESAPENTLNSSPADKLKEIKKGVALSSDEDLVKMAADLMEAAKVELAGERRVRTQSGAELYNKPIGTLIGNGSGNVEVNEGGREVTLERLQNLYAQAEEFKRAGNLQEAKRVMATLREAITDYSDGDNSAKRFFDVLKGLQQANHTSGVTGETPDAKSE